jgi:hypothetical protein
VQSAQRLRGSPAHRHASGRCEDVRGGRSEVEDRGAKRPTSPGSFPRSPACDPRTSCARRASCGGVAPRGSSRAQACSDRGASYQRCRERRCGRSCWIAKTRTAAHAGSQCRW